MQNFFLAQQIIHRSNKHIDSIAPTLAKVTITAEKEFQS